MNKKKKNKGGKPRKFPTEQSMLDIIVAYFKECEESKKIPSKAGLLLKLDIDRQVYSDYKKRYPDAIRVAEHTIERAWVERLPNPGATGPIFYLKNAFHDIYKDRTETDLTSGGKPIKLYELPNRDTPQPQTGAGADTN